MEKKYSYRHLCEVGLDKGSDDYDICGEKAVIQIKDVVCKFTHPNKPFWVCKKHKKEFLKGNHYKEIK